ncbi:hypothetical protein [Bacillus thuringiensis]|uniref:hypothetical protein n=1 Tax=Bacillus thuringiensis TaxID=1428 RepID=UPI0021D65822|nr:hypothetical protein [Bacillus thuringiensis]MCU7667339.1 hypothetical protein [Bacillus thuringiensis]
MNENTTSLQINIEGMINSPELHILRKQLMDFVQDNERENAYYIRENINGKPYHPNNNSLNNISKIDDVLIETLQKLSPFMVQNPITTTYMNFDLKDILGRLIPFTKKQIERMTESTRLRVVKLALLGVDNALTVHKNITLDERKIMFYDTFESEKLRILMEGNEDKMIVLEEDAIHLIRNIFSTVLSKWLHYYIGFTTIPKLPSYIQFHQQEENYMLYDLCIETLKQFPHLDASYMENLNNSIVCYLLEGHTLSNEEISEIREFKSCPFLHELYDYSFLISKSDNNEIVPNDKVIQGNLGLFQKTRNVVQLLDELYILIRNSIDFENIAAHILSFAEFVQSISSRLDITTICDDTGLELIAEVIDCLPKLEQMLKRQY